MTCRLETACHFGPVIQTDLLAVRILELVSELNQILEVDNLPCWKSTSSNFAIQLVLNGVPSFEPLIERMQNLKAINCVLEHPGRPIKNGCLPQMHGEFSRKPKMQKLVCGLLVEKSLGRVCVRQ